MADEKNEYYSRIMILIRELIKDTLYQVTKKNCTVCINKYPEIKVCPFHANHTDYYGIYKLIEESFNLEEVVTNICERIDNIHAHIYDLDEIYEVPNSYIYVQDYRINHYIIEGIMDKSEYKEDIDYKLAILLYYDYPFAPYRL